MPALVLDCSMALSWNLPDEVGPVPGHIEQVVAESGALAPLHWPLEIANALTMALRRGRIDAAFREGILADLRALRVELDDGTVLQAWGESLRLADDLRLTVYDAAYLELARRRALPLATKDKALAAAAKRIGVATP